MQASEYNTSNAFFYMHRTTENPTQKEPGGPTRNQLRRPSRFKIFPPNLIA
jgi:hypothetical protein